MKEHEGCKRSYVRSSKAFYAKVLNEPISVMVGMYHPEGGTSGEFEFEWVDLGASTGLCPRLKCFNDAWNALAQFKDLLHKMSELDDKIQEPEFCKVLDELGIIDITEYERDTPDTTSPASCKLNLMPDNCLAHKNAMYGCLNCKNLIKV